MASFMPVYAKSPERTDFFLLMLVLLLALTGCQGAASDNRFTIQRIEARWTNGWVSVKCEQKLVLSSEARDALIHGVPLTLELELLLRNAGSQVRAGADTRRYEIRYLPMSEHYQLEQSGTANIKTFPRLRHVLADLSQIRLSFETGVLPGGDYEIMARMSLDQRTMPPPMRLPALLSSNWHHDSSWSSWPLVIKPEA